MISYVKLKISVDFSETDKKNYMMWLEREFSSLGNKYFMFYGEKLITPMKIYDSNDQYNRNILIGLAEFFKYLNLPEGINKVFFQSGTMFKW
jgi:hypothetical protein